MEARTPLESFVCSGLLEASKPGHGPCWHHKKGPSDFHRRDLNCHCLTHFFNRHVGNYDKFWETMLDLFSNFRVFPRHPTSFTSGMRE